MFGGLMLDAEKESKARERADLVKVQAEKRRAAAEEAKERENSEEQQQPIDSQQPPNPLYEFYVKYYGEEHDAGDTTRLVNKWKTLFAYTRHKTANDLMPQIQENALEAFCPSNHTLTIGHINNLNNVLDQGIDFAHTSKSDKKEELSFYNELDALLSDMKKDFNAVSTVQRISFETKYFGNNGLFNDYFTHRDATYKWKDTHISSKDKNTRHHFYTELKQVITAVSLENPTPEQIKEVQRLFAQKPNFAPRGHDIFSGIYRLFSGKKECTDVRNSLYAVLSKMEKDFYALPAVSKVVEHYNTGIMAQPLPHAVANSLSQSLENARAAGQKKNELIIPFRYNRNS